MPQNYDFSEQIQQMSDFMQPESESSGWQTALKVLLGGILFGIIVNWLINMFGKKEEETQTYTTGFPLIQSTRAPIQGVAVVKPSPFEPISACAFSTTGSA
jgi:hypothetical protein